MKTWKMGTKNSRHNAITGNVFLNVQDGFKLCQFEKTQLSWNNNFHDKNAFEFSS